MLFGPGFGEKGTKISRKSKKKRTREVHPQYEIGVMPNDTTRGSNKRVHPTHEIIVRGGTKRKE